MVQRFILMLAPSLMAAAITNVRVAGTTPTQAVLRYTAPDGGACTVAVSTSASYTPLVPDVDPALFAGANSDGRPGNLNSGRSRVFVVGKRSVEHDLAGNNSSRALQAATLHYFRITCPSDSSTASGTFVTQTIPGGVGYADPIPADPANNGNYIYPSFAAADRNFAVVDPQSGTLVKNMTLAGDITDAGVGMSSSGLGFMCHPKPVKASDENKYGYHCQIRMNSGGGRFLYWIAPDGETRFLGSMVMPYAAPWTDRTRVCAGMLSHPFSEADPNTFYCVSSTTVGARVLIEKGVYTGHSVAGQDADLTGQSQVSALPHATFTKVTPDDRDLGALLEEFDPRFTSSKTMFSYRFNEMFSQDRIVWYMWGAAQDTLAWMSVFDLHQTAAMQQAKFGSAAGCVDNPAVTGSTYAGQAGCMVASTGTFNGGPGSPFRWSVLHTMESSPNGTGGYLIAAFNPVGWNDETWSYKVTLTSNLSATAGSCTMAQPGGNWITDWPDASWSYGCSTITVSGDPATGASPASNYPATIPAEVGDLLSISSQAYQSYELLRLLDKGPDGRTWYVQRQYRWPGVYANMSRSSGQTLAMLSPGAKMGGWRVWWDIAAEPKTTSAATLTTSAPHTAYVNHEIYGRWTYITGSAQSGSDPRQLEGSPLSMVVGYPMFNGIGAIGSLAVETHPSLSVTNPASEQDYRQVVDARPYFGNTSIVTAARTTLVAGQLYRIRGTDVASKYKLIPYFANSGSRAMRETSGPSATLATDSAAQFRWCVALANGECYSGSLAGDIYFNAPSIANAYCTNNWSLLQTTMAIPNDICVSPSHAIVQAIQMQQITPDPFGLQSRIISHALAKYEGQSNFWNVRTLPDGSWLFGQQSADNQLKLFRVPPRAPDSANRTTYVPVSVSLGPEVGADNAYAEFGYAENGDPGSYYCTARQESCVAQSATLSASQPFYFSQIEAGSITGMPCSGGCTITMPGLPGRVIYYRITTRDAAGNVIGRLTGAEPVP